MVATTTGKLKVRKLAELARSVASIEGDVAECGVFQGGSLRELALVFPGRLVVGFDTFTGLPKEAWTEGELHHVGDFHNSSLELVRSHLADLPNTLLVPGIFPASAEEHQYREFAFVYLDFDFYKSTKDAIEWFLPRMRPGAIMVFDDYDWTYCPGVKRAIDELGLTVEITTRYQASYRKV